jgi:glycosyltransferase involved in cell wall biosynthesis
MRSWICCQLGAREHYAVPRALQSNGLLAGLITDLWMRRVNRFHRDLADVRVMARNVAALRFELKASLARENGWKLIGERNEWFQRQVLVELKRTKNGVNTVFAYSYAAAEIFKFARERGWRTVLGQIDPGPAEERIVATLNDNKWQPAPKEYWDNWRRECSLADRIVVNSQWSKEALLTEGIPAKKIHIIPLAYESSAGSRPLQRLYPHTFSAERPLRVLFLGQINLRKGVRQLLEAVQLLNGEPVEFWFVGPTQISVPQDLRLHPQCRWFGAARRNEVDNYYRDADVFILPTLSDGFGLTQLEAQSWKLPVIASRYCGEVVRDGFNGVLLNEVSGEAIANALRQFLQTPATLSTMSARSGVDDRFSLQTLASSLKTL